MLVLLVTGVVAVNAQDADYTSYLENADLSSGKAGWTFTTSGGGWSDVVGNAPSKVVEAYAGWGSLEMTSYSMKQSVTLPAGKYRAEGYAFYRYGNAYNTDASKSYANIVAGVFKATVTPLGGIELGGYANDVNAASSAFTDGNYLNQVEFAVESEGEVEIGFEGTHVLRQSWFIVGPVKLYRTGDFDFSVHQAYLENLVNQAQALQSRPMSSAAGSPLSTAISNYSGQSYSTTAEYAEAFNQLEGVLPAAQVSADAYEAFKSVIDIFKDAYEDLDANGKAAYDDGGVLSALESSYNNGTLQEITSDQRTAMANALAVASKAQNTAGAPMSWAITNHHFETGSLQGWTNSGMQVQANKAFPGVVGDFYAEAWMPNGTRSLSQNVTGLPAGTYQLSFNALARGITSASVTANGQSSAIANEDATNTYTIEEITVADDGALSIAYEAEGTGADASWVAIDYFQLTLMQPAAAPEHTITLGITGITDNLPSVTVAGATQSGDVAYTATAGSTISITPEAKDGYSVEVTVTQTPPTGGPAETVDAPGTNGTWSFTLPDNDVNVSIAYTPLPTYAVTLLTTGTEEMETMPAVSLTGGTIVENVFTATAGSTITVSAQAVQGYSVDVTVTETAPAGDPQTITPTLSNGKWSFTQPDYNTTVTVAYTHRINTITWVLVGLDESVEKPAVTFSGNGLVPVMEGETITSYQGPQGSTVTFTAPEIEGYEIDRVYNGGYEQTLYANEGVYSFGIGRTSQEYFDSSDHNIQIVYTKINYTITGLPVDNTTLTIGENEFGMGDVTATVGTIITVTPDLGYQITAITATYTPATGGDPIELTIDDAAGNGKSFTMPAANVTVTCTAEEIVIDPNAIPVTVPAMSFVTYVDYNQDLSLATGDQAQLYGVSDVTATEVQLTDQLTSVPSGQHFLIYNPTDADIIAQLMPSAPTGGFEGVGNWFYLDINDGTINPDDYTGFTLYICGGKQFLKAIGAGQLADHRWMLMVDNEPSDGGMKSRNIVFGETTNKITATNIKNATKGDFFDLSGRKVKAPKKGLYIVNGKKAVIK